MKILAIVVIVAVALIGFAIHRSGRYYRRLFSDESYREFFDGITHALEVAQSKAPGAAPAVEDRTAFQTASGLAVGVSASDDDGGGLNVHVSLSQVGRPTTHAACSHFGFLVVNMLSQNRATLTPFFTDSGVHHLVFHFESRNLLVRSFDEVVAAHRDAFSPIPFRHERDLSHGPAPGPGS